MILFAACYLILSLYFQSQGIPAGDSGDLVTAAATLGIAHPPGYPLYVMLGWLVNQLPVLTPAWRIGILSSFFHAATIYLVGRIALYLTKSKGASLFAMTALGANYLFFLYSITPEVFALLDFFIVLLLWLLTRWKETKDIRVIYLLSFVLGLSLTHHHVVLFTFPAIIYFFIKQTPRPQVNWYTLLGFFIAGLIPYTYIAYPPHGTSMIVWNPATSVENVVKLITRADYGTFQSAIVYGQLPIQRLLNIQTYAQYITIDFLWLGWILIMLGGWTIIKKRERIGTIILLMLLFLGPVFYFYASFPLSYRFSLGTLERFLLPTYTLLSIVLSVGYAALLQYIKRIKSFHKYTTLLASGIGILLFLYPIQIGRSTIGKTIGYNIDKTAQHVAEDILNSLPADAILLVDRDTILFTTQYVRYALNMRPDVIVIQGYKLNFEDQRQIIKDRFPHITIPTQGNISTIEAFIRANNNNHRIFSYMKYDIDKESAWEPHGLVYEYRKRKEDIQLAALIEKQKRLWSLLHSPQHGLLSRYKHLIMSDVLDIYTTARAEYGKYLIQVDKPEEAKEVLTSALSYGGDATIAQAYMYRGISEALVGECHEAIADFTDSRSHSFLPIPEISYYLGVTYRDCVKDEKKAAQYFAEFKSATSSKETQLQSL